MNVDQSAGDKPPMLSFLSVCLLSVSICSAKVCMCTHVVDEVGTITCKYIASSAVSIELCTSVYYKVGRHWRVKRRGAIRAVPAI